MPTEELRARLREIHPDATTELDWSTPFELLIATILAAQCTDERVNRVTKTLFATYPTPQSFADAPIEELEEALRPTGFYKNKSKAVKKTCQILIEQHGGNVPNTMKELTKLAGVARKTANMVLGTAMQIQTGICTDTHVSRVSNRIGLVAEKKVEAIERSLMEMVPEEDWTWFGHAMTLHGRYVCVAQKPKCGECRLAEICAKVGV